MPNFFVKRICCFWCSESYYVPNGSAKLRRYLRVVKMDLDLDSVDSVEWKKRTQKPLAVRFVYPKFGQPKPSTPAETRVEAFLRVLFCCPWRTCGGRSTRTGEYPGTSVVYYYYY